jgi:hypothetical protein
MNYLNIFIDDIPLWHKNSRKSLQIISKNLTFCKPLFFATYLGFLKAVIRQLKIYTKEDNINKTR